VVATAIRVRPPLWSSIVFETYSWLSVLVTMKRLLSPGGRKFVTAAEKYCYVLRLIRLERCLVLFEVAQHEPDR
jgi:hypothetical protein